MQFQRRFHTASVGSCLWLQLGHAKAVQSGEAGRRRPFGHQS